MLCPVCETVHLQISERQNIEIDYCPQCRGVWLDRGELDKIIERANSSPTPATAQRNPANSPYAEKRKNDELYDDDEPGYYGDRDRHVPYDERRRKKSFLDDIFDIFD